MSELYGRKTIKLPETELTLDIFKKYLQSIMSIHLKNSQDINILNDYYVGKQDILYKEKEVRPSINNKLTENHAFEIAEFWKGYMVGRPIKYAQVSVSSLTNDIGMLNTYMIDQLKAGNDTEMWKWLALCGRGYYLCLPKKKDVQEIDKEAPFNLILCDPRDCECIYSSYVGNKKLGGFILTDITGSLIAKQKRYMLTVYTPNQKIEIETNGTGTKIYAERVKDLILPFTPLIEYHLNGDRLGIVEVVKSFLDALNMLSSNQLDDVQQFVNNLMVFVNADITKKVLEEMQALKVVKVNTANPAVPADIKILQQSLNHADVEVLYNRIYNRMLGVIATPKASDRASSGGDTGQARLLGEGWTLADQRANSYENMITMCEKELLSNLLYICRANPACKINKLYASDIEVKFSRSKSDNMLVKSQVILNLQTAGLPEEVITQVSELFGEDLEVANAWKANLEKKKQEEVKTQTNNENQEFVANNQDNRTKNNLESNKE